MRPKGVISAEAKKLSIRDNSNYLNDIQYIFTSMVGFVIIKAAM